MNVTDTNRPRRGSARAARQARHAAAAEAAAVDETLEDFIARRKASMPDCVTP